VQKARSDGWLNTMPFHKTPESVKHQEWFYGMTQRVLARPCSEVISHAIGIPEVLIRFFLQF
jgi:hypothetical protein